MLALTTVQSGPGAGHLSPPHTGPKPSLLLLLGSICRSPGPNLSLRALIPPFSLPAHVACLSLSGEPPAPSQLNTGSPAQYKILTETLSDPLIIRLSPGYTSQARGSTSFVYKVEGTGAGELSQQRRVCSSRRGMEFGLQLTTSLTPAPRGSNASDLFGHLHACALTAPHRNS